MNAQQQLDALKRLTPAQLAAKCRSRTCLPPTPVWNRKFPGNQFPAWTKPWTIADTLRFDPHSQTFNNDEWKPREPKLPPTPLQVTAYVKAYCEAFERARNLIPATVLYGELQGERYAHQSAGPVPMPSPAPAPAVDKPARLPRPGKVRVRAQAKAATGEDRVKLYRRLTLEALREINTSAGQATRQQLAAAKARAFDQLRQHPEVNK